MPTHQGKDRKMERGGGAPRVDSISRRALDQEMDDQARVQLEHAVDAYRRGLDVYQSLQNLNEVIGTEYGDRVLYELLQNAHDAHRAGNQGRIRVKLVAQSETEGTLYVANDGVGFEREDVKAIKNIAVSAKEIGEGIGNKGLGFRSIEALSDDVRIYSQLGERQANHFEGYCFRFAAQSEIASLIRSYGFDGFTAAEVARTVPRYLVPRPLPDQTDTVADFARQGYATVVVAPLRTRQALSLATEQVRALADLEAPLLLFLDRLREIRIEAQLPNQKPWRRVLSRRQTPIDKVSRLPGCELHEVGVGEGHRFLVIRREVEKSRVLDAVDRSIDAAPQLRRWRHWKGNPVVSVAVELTAGAAVGGRLYNFLPMGREALGPLMGYLDAPFFAEIDRRNADLDLPLNRTLLEVAAEACAAAALHIVESGMPLPAQTVFDLVAWSDEYADALEKALQDLGAPLEEARIIPAIPVDGKMGWSSLSEIGLWPKGKFSVFTPRAVARYVGAPLVASELDDHRLQRLQEMACRVSSFRSLLPSGRELARWAEIFARSLVKREAAPRTWSRYYADLVSGYEEVDSKLDCLAGREILLDRSGKLRLAGPGGSNSSQGDVFVRRNVAKGKRTAEGVPLPPSTLTRRYRFLSERIVLRRDTLEAFVSAGLVREYDPVEALAGLRSALGRRANSKRRTEALMWVFRVWQAAGSAAEEVLRDADLYVPTLSGWRPASEAAFSSSWTSVGQILENYLTEAAAVSPDCQRARERLLIGYEDWPSFARDAKRRWVQFLDAVGVADGLRPIPADLKRHGSPANLWGNVLRSGVSTAALDGDWCAEVAHVSLNYPYTHYELHGEAWRLPGQLEHHELPESAKEALCRLVLEHLKTHTGDYFKFYLGRYDRPYHRDRDENALPTPLAVFLRSKRWLAAISQGEFTFCRPDECWASRARRGGPPRFLTRAPEAIHEIVQNDELAALVFGDTVGLRDWQSEATAVGRLVDLASVAPELAPNERPRFREEYRRAWSEVTALDEDLPSNLKVAVARGETLETLVADPENPPTVVVTQDAQRFEARVLSSAARAVLDVGVDAPVDKVLALLEATEGFRPNSLDGVGVRLLVDGEPFVPSVADPRLTSSGLDWLPEVLVIAHELRGEQLERGVLKVTVERKARAIRVRSCETLSLVLEGEAVPPGGALPFYAFEHEELPTLIVPKSLPLNWRTLAESLSAPISRLIDRRIRSLEPVLLRLAIDQPSEDVEAPSDEALARALGCNVATVQEHRLAMRTDTARVLYMLDPLTAYYGGVELARRLRTEADRTGIQFDIQVWVAANLAIEHSPDEVLQACKRAADRAELRRQLNLDYAGFNRALAELGEPMLSNEEELRQLYGAYLAQMRPLIVERVRRHHFEDFQEGRDLQAYVDRTRLTFLPFNTDWVLTRETLDLATVEEHVFRLLDETLGPDMPVDLAAFSRVLEANRRSVRRFAQGAAPVIRAWCRKHDVPTPEPWREDDPQVIVRHLENQGLLDFEPMEHEQIPVICRRAGCWPANMPPSLDRSHLAIGEREVDEENERRERERRQNEIAQRSIEFAGRSLDTGDADFADAFRETAEEWLAADESWFDRSRRRIRLTELHSPERGLGGGHGGKGNSAQRRERRLTEAQRSAMGLAGEWLAYRFLKRRDPDYVDEACWISENRARFFGGGEGDDGMGFDFRVRTPQAEWLYEVKSSLEDSGEFELTANELRVASSAAKDRSRRYRILYVPFVFSPDKWYVAELPNPMGEKTRHRFEPMGRGSVRFRFERR